ncbi:hypothetical protein OSB04_031699 [Centaurea solstitialis]|uniref:RRM domain-containing protein n=1 Tax=Centaurea solstitialis TaxID=347529 RepID=A0AA38SN52_9ASTR|nr:hypothetical protein OSB04_031699 [Centaurea solstitialis]
MVFDDLASHIKTPPSKTSKKLFLYPRFVQTFINAELPGLAIPLDIYKRNDPSSKIFAFLRKPNKDFFGSVTPLFPTTRGVTHSQDEDSSLQPKHSNTPPKILPTSSTSKIPQIIVSSTPNPSLKSFTRRHREAPSFSVATTHEPASPSLEHSPMEFIQKDSPRVCPNSQKVPSQEKEGHVDGKAQPTVHAQGARQDRLNITKTFSTVTQGEQSSRGPGCQETMGVVGASARQRTSTNTFNDPSKAGQTPEHGEDRYTTDEVMVDMGKLATACSEALSLAKSQAYDCRPSKGQQDEQQVDVEKVIETQAATQESEGRSEAENEAVEVLLVGLPNKGIFFSEKKEIEEKPEEQGSSRDKGKGKVIEEEVREKKSAIPAEMEHQLSMATIQGMIVEEQGSAREEDDSYMNVVIATMKRKKSIAVKSAKKRRIELVEEKDEEDKDLRIVHWEICVNGRHHAIRVTRSNGKTELHADLERFVEKMNRRDVDDLHEDGNRLYRGGRVEMSTMAKVTMECLQYMYDPRSMIPRGADLKIWKVFPTSQVVILKLIDGTTEFHLFEKEYKLSLLKELFEYGMNVYGEVLEEEEVDGEMVEKIKKALEWLCMLFDVGRVQHLFVQNFEVLNEWKLYETCGVYSLVYNGSKCEYCLVEGEYDHSLEKLQKMIEKGLSYRSSSEMGADLVIKGFKSSRNRKEVSFFFFKFPESSEAADLWRTFKKLGDASDIFMARKRLKNGKKFGFIRFRVAGDYEALRRRLTNVWIRMFKLVIYEARSKSGFENSSKTNLHHGEAPKVNIRRAEIGRLNYKSYCEAVRNGIHNTKSKSLAREEKTEKEGMESDFQEIYLGSWEEDSDNSDYLKSCLVSAISSTDNNEAVSKLVSSIWERSNVKYLEGKQVLIYLVKEDNVRLAESNPKHGIHYWVRNLCRWSKGYREVERITWLIVTGVPLHGWKEEIFTSIAGKWGQMIKTSNCNLLDDNVLNEGES